MVELDKRTNGTEFVNVPYLPKVRFVLSSLGINTGPFQVHPNPVTKEGQELAKCETERLLRNGDNNGTDPVLEARGLLVEGKITGENFVTVFESFRGPVEIPADKHKTLMDIYQRHIGSMVEAIERLG